MQIIERIPGLNDKQMYERCLSYKKIMDERIIKKIGKKEESHYLYNKSGDKEIREVINRSIEFYKMEI